MTTQIDGTTGIDRVEPLAYKGQAGELFDFAGTVAPSYAIALPKVATTALRSTYPELFAAIGETWGAGDGSTTFGLPYMAEDEVGLCADGNVGTSTVGVVLAHTHTYQSTQNAQNAMAYGQGAVNTDKQTTAQTPAGGTKNLAAGMRVLKCVRIR